MAQWRISIKNNNNKKGINLHKRQLKFTLFIDIIRIFIERTFEIEDLVLHTKNRFCLSCNILQIVMNLYICEIMLHWSCSSLCIVAQNLGSMHTLTIKGNEQTIEYNNTRVKGRITTHHQEKTLSCRQLHK